MRNYKTCAKWWKWNKLHVEKEEYDVQSGFTVQRCCGFRYPQASSYPEGKRHQPHTRLYQADLNIHPFWDSLLAQVPLRKQRLSSGHLGLATFHFLAPDSPWKRGRAANLPCSQNSWGLVSRHEWWASPSRRKKIIRLKPRKWPVPITTTTQIALPLRQNGKKSVSFRRISKACFIRTQNAFFKLLMSRLWHSVLFVV